MSKDPADSILDSDDKEMIKQISNPKLGKPILLFSGGLDSTTLLWQLKPNVKCISFDYGQRHGKELNIASELCKIAGVEHQIVDLTTTIYTPELKMTSVSELLVYGSLTNPNTPVPHGHYAEESMKSTIVPNRNAIMLSIAFGWAVATKSPYVYYAAHAGDHSVYPDCRPAFTEAFNQAMLLGNLWWPPSLITPYINISKAEIVKQGLAVNCPYELSWSCYEGKTLPCGKCGTCVERLEAFSLNGVKDPLEYA